MSRRCAMRTCARLVSVVAAAAIAAACSSRGSSDPGPEPGVRSVTERVAVRQTVPIDSFVADIPASVEGGECQTRVNPALGREVGLAFPNKSSPVRLVWLTYSDSGELTHYSDMRGDLDRRVVGPDGGPPRPGEAARLLPPAGRQTSINLNFQHNAGVAMNLGGDREQQTTLGPAETFMTAEKFGNLRAIVQLITSRCGR